MKLQHYIRSAGPILGSGRFLRRSWTFAHNRVATLLWRAGLEHMGDRTLIQRRVEIEHPKRVSLGDDCLITSGACLTSESDDGWLTMGNRSQINAGVRLDCSGGIEIGDEVVISEEAVLFTHDHGHDPHSRPTMSALRIGAHAWIGARALILPGVTSIGAHAIVAAGAVVSRDVPEGTIVAGNPAKVVGSNEIRRGAR